MFQFICYSKCTSKCRLEIQIANFLYFYQDMLFLDESPVALPKALKNPTEIEGMKKANVSNME